MNGIFLAIVLIAFSAAAWREITHVAVAGSPSPMEALSAAVMSSASGAVELALGLVGMGTPLMASPTKPPGACTGSTVTGSPW